MALYGPNLGLLEGGAPPCIIFPSSVILLPPVRALLEVVPAEERRLPPSVSLRVGGSPLPTQEEEAGLLLSAALRKKRPLQYLETPQFCPLGQPKQLLD